MSKLDGFSTSATGAISSGGVAFAGSGDFEPSSEWMRADGLHTLEIHLPGFKKEQLRVQIDTHGKMKISGERQTEGNRWSRFSKEFHAPKDSNAAEITAKFVKGVLQIKLPTKTENDKPTPTVTETPRTPAEENEGEKKSEEVIGSTAATAATSFKPALSGLAFRLNVEKRLVVGVVISLIVALALGAYGVYTLRSSAGEGEN